jgi:hypothetical protein
MMHLKKHTIHMETFRRNTPNGWADFNRLPSQMTEKIPECLYFTISHSISIVHIT